MTAKGWNRILTDEQVRKIREMRNQGAPQVELAKLFGVTQATISKIVRHEARKDAGGPRQERQWSK